MKRAALAMLLALLLPELCIMAAGDPGPPPAPASPAGRACSAMEPLDGRQPPVSGEWLVSSAEAYSGQNIQLNGNLTIVSGGSLTLSNVKLSLVGTYEGEFHVEVQAGGELIVSDRDGNPASPDDATVVFSGSSFCYQFWVRAGGKLSFSNSVLKNCGYSLGPRGETSGLYLQSGDCELTNSTFRESYCGVAVDGCAPRLDNCTFQENRLCGLYVRDADLRIASNLFDQNGAYTIDTSGGILMSGSTAVVAGNLFRGNFHNGLCAQRSNVTLDRNIFQLNKWPGVNLDRSPAVSVSDEFYQNGLGFLVTGASLELESAYFIDNPYSLHVQDARVVMRNTTMMNSTHSSLYLGRNTDHSEVLSYNCTFQTAEVNDPYSWLEVRWSLELGVVWESSGAPVQGAALKVFDRIGYNLFNLTTNDTGAVPRLVLTQYRQTRDGRTDLNPYRLGIFKLPYYNSTYITVDSDFRWSLYLDDVPPRFTLAAPRENQTISRAWVNFTGNLSTDLNAALTINGTPVTVDRHSGNFSARVNLTEGKNVVNVTAIDIFGNSYTVIRTVHRDSTPPALAVDLPDEGLLINRTRQLLTGRTDPGSYLTVNGLVPGLGPDGGFQMQLDLVEGPNAVSVYSADQYQNGVWANRTITVDTVAPVLEIVSPAISAIVPHAPASPDGEVWVNRQVLRVEGRTERGASLFLMGAQLELAGANFSVNINLTGGDNLLTFSAQDPAGNWNSTTVLAHLDTTPPAFNITYPPEGVPVNRSWMNVSGTTEPGVRVSSRDGSVTQAGTDFWIYCYLYPGPNQIAVELRDRAGNVRKAVIDLTLDLQATLRLNRPQNYTSTDEPSIRVEGIAEPGAQVMVNYLNASVSPDGSFNVKVSLQKGPNIIVINVTDVAGNSAGYEIVVFRNEPVKADYGMLGYLAAGVVAIAALGAAGWFVLRRKAEERPKPGPSVSSAAPMPWEESFERPVLKAPEQPEEELRCAQCLQPIREDWMSCHACGGPTDLITVSAHTFDRLQGADLPTVRERELKVALQKARSDILMLLDAGEPVPGRLREATVAAQLLLTGTRPDLVEKKAAELAVELGTRAERLGTERARELQKVEVEAQARLKTLLDEVEGTMRELKGAGQNVGDIERALGMARVHLRGNNLEKAYNYALEAKRAVEQMRALPGA